MLDDELTTISSDKCWPFVRLLTIRVRRCIHAHPPRARSLRRYLRSRRVINEATTRTGCAYPRQRYDVIRYYRCASIVIPGTRWKAGRNDLPCRDSRGEILSPRLAAGVIQFFSFHFFHWWTSFRTCNLLDWIYNRQRDYIHIYYMYVYTRVYSVRCASCILLE